MKNNQEKTLRMMAKISGTSLMQGSPIYARLAQSKYFVLLRCRFSFGGSQEASFPVLTSKASWDRWKQAPAKERDEVAERLVDGLSFDAKMGRPEGAKMSRMSGAECREYIEELGKRYSGESEGITLIQVRPKFYLDETLSECCLTAGLLIGFEPGREQAALSDYFEDVCELNEHHIITYYGHSAEGEMALTEMALELGQDISAIAQLYGLPAQSNEVEAWQAVFLALLHDRFENLVGPYPVEASAGPNEGGEERLH